MIELDLNGSPHRLPPCSARELRAAIAQRCPSDHVIYRLRVNGHEIPENRLEEIEPGALRRVEVQTLRPQDLARLAVGETADWIARISGVLDTAAHHFRMGRERDAAELLVSVTDALHVLVELLGGIRSFVPLDPATQQWLEGHWPGAEKELRNCVVGLVEDLERSDPVQLADRAGYLLPRSLARFTEILERIAA